MTGGEARVAGTGIPPLLAPEVPPAPLGKQPASRRHWGVAAGGISGMKPQVVHFRACARAIRISNGEIDVEHDAANEPCR